MAHPVFIVGSPRSGTSILLSALQRAGYFGYNEGHFLSLVHGIERELDRHFKAYYNPAPRLLIAHVDREDLRRRLLGVLAAEASRHQEHEPWVDKTGGPFMIEAVPSLRRMFPGCRVIYARRRALENIHSRIRKFPTNSFEFHCTGWARNMEAWRKLVTNHPGDDLLDIDQRDISQAPAATAQRIADHLLLSPMHASLVADAFTRQRPQQTEPGSAERVLSLDTIGWSAEELEIFHRVCDEEMAAGGYTEDETYRRAP